MYYCKNYTKLFALYCIFVLWPAIGNANDGRYLVQNFTPREYNGGIQNIDFAQNHDQNLFVANNLGVLSYDGNSWNLHRFNEGKKKRSLLLDNKSGRLYIGSQGDIGYLDNDWSYHSLASLLEDRLDDLDEVWNVAHHNDWIYFCTYDFILAYDGTEIKRLELESELRNTFEIEGHILVQGGDGSLYKIEGSEVSQEHELLDRGTLTGLSKYQNGLLLFYNSGDVLYYDPLSGKYARHILSQRLKGLYVNQVSELSDGRLVVCTQTQGLFIYNRLTDEVINISRDQGLLSNACLTSYQDHSGNLWVGMQSGMALVEINAPMRLIDETNDLQGSGYDVYEDEEGIYYSTSNGIYYRDKEQKQTKFLSGTEGPAYSIVKIAGQIYSGHHRGLFLLDKTEARLISETLGMWGLKQLKQDPSVVIGGTYEGLHLFRLNKSLDLEDLGAVQGFNESSRFMEEDYEGRLWVSQYYKGLYVLNFSEDFTSVHVATDNIANHRVLNNQIVLSSVENDIYFATRDGIFFLDPSDYKVKTSPLFHPTVNGKHTYLIHEDQFKNVHILGETISGYFQKISSENYRFVPSSLSQMQYLLNNDLLHASSHSQNGIYFNTHEGFIHYFPEMEKSALPQHRPIINRVIRLEDMDTLYESLPFSDLRDTTQHITIPYEDGTLQFYVQSFQFKNKNYQKFRYFLEGFDKEYGPWTSNTLKEYTNLREGDYYFYVQTQDYLNGISTSSPLQISITPPLLRSSLAKTLLSGLALLSLLFMYRLHRRKIKRESQKIEIQNSIENAVNRKRLENIEQEKQAELDALKKEKIELELNNVKSRLETSTMNLVAKNEFIDSIKNNLADIKKENNERQIKSQIDKMIREIDSTLRVQDDWAEFRSDFNKIHGDFLDRLKNEFTDLTQNDQKLCAFLRLNLNTKDIANLMNISLRGVEVARYRLRKKLRLERGENLANFIIAY